jgi:hypothetical protein
MCIQAMGDQGLEAVHVTYRDRQSKDINFKIGRTSHISSSQFPIL